MRILTFLLIVIGLISCKKQITNPNITVDDTPSTGVESYASLSSDYIFNQDSFYRFDLTIPEASLAFLDADPTAEEYVEGSLTFNGETISPIGVRYKGSVGAFVGGVSGTDWANPSGYKTATKLSMKVKINWNGLKRTFYGLKKLQFHSQNLDPSKMHERLGYWLFREMGVPAPRSVHAKLYINGEYNGVYALTEQIDGRYTDHNFADGDGNLYKEIWPIDDNGNAFSASEYLDKLKTNEDDNPSADIIRSFALAIQNATQEQIPAILEERMDIPTAVKYAIVDRMIRNDDGAFHWYCGGGTCSSHNFYWYEEPTNEKLHLLVWDLDNAFENIESNANAVTPIADAWGQITNNCEPFAYEAFGLEQKSAACDKITAGIASFTSLHDSLKQEFINGPFSSSRVNAQLDKWTAQIESAVQLAEESHNDQISVSDWKAAVTDMRNKVDYSRSNY